VRKKLGRLRTQEIGRVEFAEKTLVLTLLNATNAIDGYMEGVAAFQINCRMWLILCKKKCVEGHLQADVAVKEIEIGSSDKLDCVDEFCYLGLRDRIRRMGGGIIEY